MFNLLFHYFVSVCKKRRNASEARPDDKTKMNTSPAPSSSTSGSSRNKMEYHCPSCSEELYLSQIDILKHKKMCMSK